MSGEFTGSGVVILGAGLAGLGCGGALPGSRLYEARAYPGGHVYSHELAGFFFDEGAHISHSKDPAFVDLITDTASDVVEIPKSTVRNHWNGYWTGYPVQNHLADLPAEVAADALFDLIAAHSEPRESAQNDYREWCEAQYGLTLTDQFYEAFTEKYWRRQTAELATDWVGGRLIPTDLRNVIRGAMGLEPDAQATFSTFRYPTTGGFFSFFKDLYSELDVAYGHRVVQIDPKHRTVAFENGRSVDFEHLASSIPLPDLVRMVKDVPESIRNAASRLHHTKLLCVNLVVSTDHPTDLHWAYIYDKSIEAARVSFPGNLSPASCPPGQMAVQAEVFRDHRESWDVGGLTSVTIDQLGSVLGFAPEQVVARDAVTVDHAYVISDHDRASAVRYIIGWLKQAGISTMGLYGTWEYMWSDRAFASGAQTASHIKERME